MEVLFHHPFFAMMDHQVFGVVVPFPIAFGIASLGSVLTIQILLQVTLKQLVLAISSAAVANYLAFWVASRVGPVFEVWHVNRFHRFQSLRSAGYKQVLSAMDDDGEFGLGEGGPRGHTTANRISASQKNYDGDEASVRVSTSVLNMAPRNYYFIISVITSIFIGNVFGMMLGSYASQHLPSNLRDRQQ